MQSSRQKKRGKVLERIVTHRDWGRLRGKRGKSQLGMEGTELLVLSRHIPDWKRLSTRLLRKRNIPTFRYDPAPSSRSPRNAGAGFAVRPRDPPPEKRFFRKYWGTNTRLHAGSFSPDEASPVGHAVPDSGIRTEVSHATVCPPGMPKRARRGHESVSRAKCGALRRLFLCPAT